MNSRSLETFHDQIIRADEALDLPERFFDRFVFNLHPTDRTSSSIVFGLGVHPVRDVVDGFTIISTPEEQRNLRYSTLLSATAPHTCGPFSYEIVEPNQAWRLALGDNPSGLTFDLEWTARTPAWWGDIDVENSSGETTSFSHLFQSGWMSGTLALDEDEHRVDGWYSQRDRSRGVRTMAGGQGLHVWFQAQFDDRSIGFLLVESRDGSRILLEGAVMHTDGSLDDIIDVRHALVFDDQLDLVSGRVYVETESGLHYVIDADASAGGGYLAGGGYGNHHGASRGADHIESDVYALDGSVSPRTLDSSLTDRLCTFDWAGRPGSGIFEFALTRSPSYRYSPTAR